MAEKKQTPESKVLKDCMKYLKSRGIMSWRNTTGAVKAQSGYWLHYGKKGSSDIIGVLPDGRALFIECKAPKGGKLSPEQKEFLDGARMANNIAFNTRNEAITALETIAHILPMGLQKDSLIAVIDWINANHAPDITYEQRQRIQSIYDRYAGDEHARKKSQWDVEGGEPPHGTRAEVPFLFNSKTKTWELEGEMPPVWTEPNPDILPIAAYEGGSE